MVYKYNKKGQAAIEFLMTYGWMLLVVLIVGALIFSFVDFGSLLPNKLELNNNLLPDLGESTAMVDSVASTNNVIVVSFKYSGTKPVLIDPLAGSISYNLADSTCASQNITNAGTGTSSEVAGTPVQFRNGHAGYLVFRDCADFNEIDSVEGDVTIQLESAERGIVIPSSGSIRINIVETATAVITAYD